VTDRGGDGKRTKEREEETANKGKTKENAEGKDTRRVSTQRRGD